MNSGKIYIIRNRINDKVYIGQTTQSLHARFIQHIKPKAQSHGDKLHNAIHRFGSDNFYIELLQDNIPAGEILDDRERYWIAEYNSFLNGYNSTTGGQLGTGLLYVSDKMLKDFDVYDIISAYKSEQNPTRKSQIVHQFCQKMKKIFPEHDWDRQEQMLKNHSE